MTEVYLDHAATTKLSKEALGAMLPYLLNEYGNPSSQYSIGERARKAVTKAREQIAAALWCSPEEIYFTSGGTEADNWAFELAVSDERTGQILVSQIEHPAVRKKAETYEKAGLRVERIPVDENGIIILSALEKMVGPDTRLVSVMTVNNEIGTIQPIRSSVVWGPFSIVWGLGAAFLTVLLYKYRDRDRFFLFAVGTLLGGVYEYFCSVFTDCLWQGVLGLQ